MEGFTPGFFDRLLGTSIRGVGHATVTRMSLEDFKDSVARDLEALLNTRSVIAEDVLKNYPECSESIVTYGLIDFADRSLSSPSDRAYICSCLEKTIARHEPRLRNVKAMLEVREDSVNRLKFSITALLVASTSQEPVNFDALLQPSTLQYSISKAGRRRIRGSLSLEQLLPYYERELGYLRRNVREFAERYPKIAGRLLISGEVCEDPHTERMIESFALLNARIAKRLDDDYPEFTDALFDVLYPHYLRPFPSCSIAHLDTGGVAKQQTGTSIIARGTELNTRPIRGAACTFRTVYPVAVAPLALSAATFSAIIDSPDAVRLPEGATAGIALTLSCTAEQLKLAQLCRGSLPKLRIFIDGEPSFCAALRDALFMRTIAAYAEADRDGRWAPVPVIPIAAAGFGEDEALIDFPARSHTAYRLLTEYFCFPEKFNFFDIDLAALTAALPRDAATITLHLALGGVRADSNTARMLGSLSTTNLLLGCTPVINLFRQRGEPIRLTHASASYPVLADARRAFAYEVQTIDSVNLVRQTPQGETVVEFRPFYSLRHAQTPEQHGHYWVMRRDDTLVDRSPGFEAQIAIVDIDFDPAAIDTQTLNIELTCSNRDLPASLAYGQRGGDLFLEGGASVRSISFLRKPSLSQRFERGRSAHWRLISHLSLNHLSLADGGVDAFREMLALYDLPRSPASQRQIGGIAAIEQRATSAWMDGNPFTCLVRGLEVRLAIDEEAFVGSGIHAFASVVERFLALYVHANSFTQLVVVSNKTGEALLKCTPRSGDLSLL